MGGDVAMIEATTSRMASLSLPSGASICHRYKASVATIGSMKESVAYHFSCFVIIGGLQSAFAEQVQPEQVKRTPGDLWIARAVPHAICASIPTLENFPCPEVECVYIHHNPCSRALKDARRTSARYWVA